jgi:type III pantothenate kinase
LGTIVAGCLTAQAGAIERAYALHQSASGAARVSCLLSGGAAPFIAPRLSIPARQIDNLVLVGLHAAAAAGAAAAAT